MKGLPKTGIPDGAGELTHPSKIRGIDRESNKGGSVGDEPNKIDMTPIPEAAKKGAFGPPIRGSAPTTQPDESEFVPSAPAPDAEKFGIGRGKWGANDGQ